RVVALDEAVLGLQDAALRVGEVALGFGVGLRRWWTGRLAGPLAALRLALFFLLGFEAALVLGRRCGFCLQRRLGLADLGQPLLLVSHPIRQLVAAHVTVQLVLLRVRRLGCRQPAID